MDTKGAKTKGCVGGLTVEIALRVRGMMRERVVTGLFAGGLQGESLPGRAEGIPRERSDLKLQNGEILLSRSSGWYH